MKFSNKRQHKKSLRSQVDEPVRKYDKFGNLTICVSLGDHTISEPVADNPLRIQKAVDKMVTKLINL